MSNLQLAVFRTGTHADNQGKSIIIDAETLAETADSYAPENHEAPLVIGHPKDDAPAFGWVEKLDFKDNQLFATFKQIHPDVPEMLKNGAFKKLSASFYTPQSSLNPTPGKYSLRHIGLLGAQPPAVKGLPSIQFAEDEQSITSWETDIEIPQWQLWKNWLRETFGDSAVSKAETFLRANENSSNASSESEKPSLSEQKMDPPLEMKISKVLENLPAKPWDANTVKQLIEKLEHLLPPSNTPSPTIEYAEIAPSHASAPPKHVEGLILRAQCLVKKHQERGQSLSFSEAVTLAQQENSHAK